VANIHATALDIPGHNRTSNAISGTISPNRCTVSSPRAWPVIAADAPVERRPGRW
jgi:hypothetical protein